MPLTAAEWAVRDQELLVELVEPHSFLYNAQGSILRKNILAKEHTWREIAQSLTKPVEECKRYWRRLHDSYVRSKSTGNSLSNNSTIFRKLHYLDNYVKSIDKSVEVGIMKEEGQQETVGMEEVIMDNQEYYEITVVGDDHQDLGSGAKAMIKILPKTEEPPKKKHPGRKRSIPMPRNLPPVKILPKPVLLNGPNIVHYIEDPKTTEQRSQTIDKLIEKVLKENTNEIDVFFRSMAASVKKLQPNLIPKVKMEVCNVIAKYEMQSFDKM